MSDHVEIARLLHTLEQISPVLAEATLAVSNSNRFEPQLCEQMGKIVLAVREVKDGLNRLTLEEPPLRQSLPAYAPTPEPAPWAHQVTLIERRGTLAFSNSMSLERLYELFRERLEAEAGPEPPESQARKNAIARQRLDQMPTRERSAYRGE